MNPGQAATTLASRDKYFCLLKDFQSRGEMMKKNLHIEIWGSHAGLYMV